MHQIHSSDDHRSLAGCSSAQLFIIKVWTNLSSPEIPLWVTSSADAVDSHDFCWRGRTNPGALPPHLRCSLPFLRRGTESDPITDPAQQPGRGTFWGRQDASYLCDELKGLSEFVEQLRSESRQLLFNQENMHLPWKELRLASLIQHFVCFHTPVHTDASLRTCSLLCPTLSSQPPDDDAGDRMQLQTSPAHFNSCKCSQVCCRATVGEILAESNRQLYQAQADLHIHYSHRLWFVQCQKTAMPRLQTGHNLQSSAIVDVTITELFNSLYFLKQQRRAYPHESLCSEALSQPLFFCLFLSPSKSSLLPL